MVYHCEVFQSRRTPRNDLLWWHHPGSTHRHCCKTNKINKQQLQTHTHMYAHTNVLTHLDTSRVIMVYLIIIITKMYFVDLYNINIQCWLKWQAAVRRKWHTFYIKILLYFAGMTIVLSITHFNSSSVCSYVLTLIHHWLHHHWLLLRWPRLHFKIMKRIINEKLSVSCFISCLNIMFLKVWGLAYFLHCPVDYFSRPNEYQSTPCVYINKSR